MVTVENLSVRKSKANVLKPHMHILYGFSHKMTQRLCFCQFI